MKKSKFSDGQIMEIPKQAEAGKFFSTNNSAQKIIFLKIQDASRNCSMPIKKWKTALNRFMIEFENRLIEYV